MTILRPNISPIKKTIPHRFEAVSQDLLIYILREFGEQQIHYIYRFDGRLDEVRLARAIRLVIEAEPVLACRFVFENGIPHWERQKDLEERDFFKVAETSQPEDDLMALAGQPHNPSIDLQVQVCLFRSVTDTLYFKISHLAADATGAREFTYQVANIYKRLVAEPDYFPPLNLWKSRSQKPIFDRLGRVKVLRSMPLGKPPGLNWGCPTDNTTANFTRGSFSLLRFDQSRMAAFKQYAKRRNVTLNDLLLTAFFRAMVATTNHPDGVPLNIMVPFNLRRFLPSENTGVICNMVGAAFPEFTSNEGEAFEETLFRVKRTMDRYKAENPGISTLASLTPMLKAGPPVLFQAARKMREYTFKSGKSIGVMSNFGIIDPGQVVFGDAEIEEAYAMCPNVYPPALMINAISFKDVLTVACGYYESATPRAYVESLLEHMDQELPGSARQE